MEKTRIELNDELNDDINKLWQINQNRTYTFFYDESNNIRKFWLKNQDKGFNSDINEDFVLAGVAYKGSRPLLMFDEIRSKLRLQSNVEELKFNKQFSEKTFWQCMEKKRLYTLFNIIEDNKMYIHYLHVNNLYYTLVELFDSITNPEELDEFGFDYFKMKSLFYDVFKGKEQELQAIMYKYQYPNIKKDSVSTFLKEIKGMFLISYQLTMEQKYLCHCVDRAIERNELIFLENNKDYVMQEDYSEFYVEAVRTFAKSKHYFDEENEIRKHLENIEFTYDGEIVEPYTFVESKMDIMVQMSDIIAGVLGKLFTYANQSNTNNIRKDIIILSDQQLKCAKKLHELIRKSEEENKGLLHSMAPVGEIQKVNSLFEFVDSEMKKRELKK